MSAVLSANHARCRAAGSEIERALPSFSVSALHGHMTTFECSLLRDSQQAVAGFAGAVDDDQVCAKVSVLAVSIHALSRAAGFCPCRSPSICQVPLRVSRANCPMCVHAFRPLASAISFMRRQNMTSLSHGPLPLYTRPTLAQVFSINQARAPALRPWVAAVLRKRRLQKLVRYTLLVPIS